MRRALALALMLATFVLSGRARAACAESVPPGATKPSIAERAPSHALAGELITLELVVKHLAGETATLPADLPRLANGEVRVADDGSWGKGEPPKPTPVPGDEAHATTVLKVPFVVLSTALQRKTFTLPEVRVVVLRKGGGDLSVCTTTHEVAIDQPTANTPDPAVRPNPPSMPQKTRDERAQAIAIAAAIAAIAALALAAFVVWMKRRPKPAPPPPPPIPSWKLAIEAIHAARREHREGTIASKAYHDRLSDAVRVHLGKTLSFDALEQTTDEILARLRRVPSPSMPLSDVERLLRDCDLVKFANVTPSAEEADEAAALAESIVRATATFARAMMPTVRPAEPARGEEAP